jgi:ribonuclease-3
VEELGVPEYHVAESGPDHQKTFRASVRVGGSTYGSGEGRSKKEAEQHAAEAAWNEIRAIVVRREAEAQAAGGEEPARGEEPAQEAQAGA